MKILKVIAIILIFNLLITGCSRDNYINNTNGIEDTIDKVNIATLDDFVLELDEPLTKNIKYGAHSNIEHFENFKTASYAPKYIHSLPCIVDTTEFKEECTKLAGLLDSIDYIYEFDIPEKWSIIGDKVYSNEYDQQWIISISPVIHKSDTTFTMDESIINFRSLSKSKEMIISNSYTYNRFMLGKENSIGVTFRNCELFINCNEYIIRFDIQLDPKYAKYLFNIIDTFKLYYKGEEIKPYGPWYKQNN